MNYRDNRVARILCHNEVVQIGHLCLWSPKRKDPYGKQMENAWTKVDRGSPFVGLPVATLRERHGQPDLQFGILKPIE